MRKRWLLFWLAITMLFGTLAPYAHGATTRHIYQRRAYAKRRARRKTIKRVGVGAAGGAVVGALAGGARGGAIGAVAGGGIGYLYDRHKKHQKRR